MARKKKNKPYLVKGDRYSIEETFKIVAPFLDPDAVYDKDHRKEKIDFYGDMIKANSQRYQTFYYKGCTCVKCGLKASYFEKNKMSDQKSFHLNLYGIDENGEEILFTKDHILPKSKGGKDHLTNFQTMCTKCNEDKSSTMSLEDKVHTVLSTPKLCQKIMVEHYKKHPMCQM